MFKEWFRSHAALAKRHGTGFILETATWRASTDWAAKLGCSDDELTALTVGSITLLEEVRDELASPGFDMVISGCVGSRGDGYSPAAFMTSEEAEAYHRKQIEIFRDTEADMVAAVTMTYAEEAIGIANAARTAGLPVAISFTVETDGTLPSGQSLGDAIQMIDAATDLYPAYYMINCAHPSHFDEALVAGDSWRERVRGVRVNASRKSHAELDESEELDDGNPVELGDDCCRLRAALPNLNILGGCCGTDQRHIDAIGAACFANSGA